MGAGRNQWESEPIQGRGSPDDAGEGAHAKCEGGSARRRARRERGERRPFLSAAGRCQLARGPNAPSGAGGDERAQ